MKTINTKPMKTMKMNKPLAALVITAILGWAAQSQAAPVTWESPASITTESEVSKSGTAILAFHVSGLGAQTVNTVTFKDALTDADWNSQNGVSAAFTGTNKVTAYGAGAGFVSGGDKTATPPSGLSQSYKDMLAGAYGSSYDSVVAGALATPVTLTLSGLTVGQRYLVQFWVADYRPFFNFRKETITAGNATDTLTYGPGTYVIGNFTADSTAQSFSLLADQANQPGESQCTQINAFQLRAVPKPTAAK